MSDVCCFIALSDETRKAVTSRRLRGFLHGSCPWREGTPRAGVRCPLQVSVDYRRGLDSITIFSLSDINSWYTRQVDNSDIIRTLGFGCVDGEQRLGRPLCLWRPWRGICCWKTEYENTSSGVVTITRCWYMLCWTWRMYSEGIVSTEIQSIGCRSELQLIGCKCQPTRNVFILLVKYVFQTSPDHQLFRSPSVNSFHFLHSYYLFLLLHILLFVFFNFPFSGVWGSGRVLLNHSYCSMVSYHQSPLSL